MTALSAELPEEGWGGRVAALVAALLLHAAALGAIWAWQLPRPAGLPGPGEIAIDLAPVTPEASREPDAVPTEVTAAETPDAEDPEDAVEAAPAQETQAAQAAEPTPEAEPETETPAEATPAEPVRPPPSEVAKAEPTEVRAAVPEDTPPATRPDDVVVAALPPRTVTAEPVPEPVRKPIPPKPVRPKPVPRRVATAPASQASEASSAQTARRASGGRGAKADPTAVSRFMAALSRVLERHKRYPPGASAQGVAMLRFTMDRSGRLLGASIVRSSGDGSLDRAALAMVRSAVPLPRLPDGMPQASLTVTVPVRFVTNR
jgi:protein TonB